MKKTLFIASLTLMFACKKEPVDPKEVIHSVTFHCYAESNNAKFMYYGSSWVTIPITNNTIDLTVQIKDADMKFIPQVYSTGADSLFIGADANGKHVELKRRNTAGNSNVSINLIQLK